MILCVYDTLVIENPHKEIWTESDWSDSFAYKSQYLLGKAEWVEFLNSQNSFPLRWGVGVVPWGSAGG